MSETAPRAKLPLWRTVRESYAWGLGHLGEVVNKAWLVLLVLAMVSFVLHWLAHPYVGVAGSVPGNLFSLVVIPLAGIVFGAMVAVPWHRFRSRRRAVAGDHRSRPRPACCPTSVGASG